MDEEGLNGVEDAEKGVPRLPRRVHTHAAHLSRIRSAGEGVGFDVTELLLEFVGHNRPSVLSAQRKHVVRSVAQHGGMTRTAGLDLVTLTARDASGAEQTAELVHAERDDTLHGRGLQSFALQFHLIVAHIVQHRRKARFLHG